MPPHLLAYDDDDVDVGGGIDVLSKSWMVCPFLSLFRLRFLWGLFSRVKKLFFRFYASYL